MATTKFLQLFLQHFLLLQISTLHFLGFCQQLKTDTITSTSSLKDPDTIVSIGQVFQLGFFTPATNSNNRYLGISYVVSQETVVWVANRDKPLTDSSGSLSISPDGNLVLSNGRNQTVWSTNSTFSSPLSTSAQILDSGNLVLSEIQTGRVIWQSFANPSDVSLPGMNISHNVKTGKNVFLSSWKTSIDPEIGNFTLGLDVLSIPQIFIWNNGKPFLRSGQWNGQIFLGWLGDWTSVNPNQYRLENDSAGDFYLNVPKYQNFLKKVTINSSGSMVRTLWDDQKKSWSVSGAVPRTICDIYGTCGPFGSCNALDSHICSCLNGFEPRDKAEWKRGNWTGGCVRRKELDCDRRNDSGGSGDVFLRLQNVKVPDFAEQFFSRREDECRTRCLSNCSCIAHAYDQYLGCLFWRESLIDIQQYSEVGLDLHIRLARSELGDHKGDNKLIIIPVIAGFLALIICIFIFWQMMLKTKGGSIRDRWFLESKIEGIEEFQLFTLNALANATDQFNDKNLLGEGGFGPVYKGNLGKGKEIAVKRLSAASGQGIEEFKNEVIVISKLQHRNLVRLIGCCIEGAEKLLVYEYMPNKSLDSSLFEPNNPLQKILDWERRFSIIEGVGRGLLYLHKDSRLKIIHRDLKPSNVLLDQGLNPKISDFGMARIFGLNQDQDNTVKVVGTYGYMAPEYATEGRFSEKSDVYSFGVIVLEIISGKKNRNYYNQEQSLSLLGSAWKMWNEDKALSFADQRLIESSNCCGQIVRCVHIALLCVQECPEDRPDIQTVLSMLTLEIMDLPLPEQPMFAEKWISCGSGFTQLARYQNDKSLNHLTVTVFEGR